MEEIKLNGESKNITQDNVDKLKELFPEVVSDGLIDFNSLKQILGENIEGNDERFIFSWPGKSKTIQNSQKPSLGTLRPVIEKSKHWDSTNNMYIEGDNYEVLKLLQKSYYKKVKMIYIDPPYNTGNDLIYKNDYSDSLENYLKITGQSINENLSDEELDNWVKLSTNTESDGRFHSNWINMIYPTLKLARNLLTDDGCLVVTIDHYELNHLLNMCNEVFGEINRLGIVSVVNNPMGRQNAKFFSVTNEFMLVYAKNFEKCSFNQVVISEDKSKEFKYQDEKGNFSWRPFLHDHKKGLRENKPNQWYPLYVSPDLKDISIDFKEDYTKVMPISKKGVERSWISAKDLTQQRIDNNELMAVKENGDIVIYRKFRAQERFFTVWTDKKYNSNHHGARLIQELIGYDIFDFPKSLYAVEDIMKIISDKDSIILDFFSGSSTTAHAAMHLNSLDNGNRKFIMVQLPFKTEKNSPAFKNGYKNICQVAEVRIDKAGEKVIKDNPNVLIDTGFKVFKLDSSNLTKWNPDVDNLEDSLVSAADNIVEGRTNLDLVYEIILKYGLELTLPVEEISKDIFSVAFGSLVICLRDNVDESVIQEIFKLIHGSAVSRVVFKDNGFKTDADKTNIKENLRVNGVDEFITI